jgi:hypothetical protein
MVPLTEKGSVTPPYKIGHGQKSRQVAENGGNAISGDTILFFTAGVSAAVRLSPCSVPGRTVSRLLLQMLLSLTYTSSHAA